MSANLAHPDFIGQYVVSGKSHFYAVTRMELDRGGHSAARVLASFEIQPGRFILTISFSQEIAQYAPFEAGMQMLGLYGTNADRSPYDAARVEAMIRLFDVAGICGVDKAVLDGLAMLKHNAAALFKNRIVWALPDAYEAVAAMPGVIARRCADIGPVLGLECHAGEGLHVDSREWALEESDSGTLLLSSRSARVQPLQRLDTGVKGRIVNAPCHCGNRDWLVTLE